jgi:6-phosphofructokinase
MRFGVQGLLANDLIDLGQQPDSFLERLRATPGAVLGSCRYRFRVDDAQRSVEVLQRQGARYLVYIGGNDSADTSHQLQRAVRQAGWDLSVVGVPKTIDNDLPLTDHCPGYGSAARFVAQATAEAGLDTESMRRTDPIKLIEVMGRHSGWLAAAAWLGKRHESSAPHLVYLPERPLAVEAILADVEGIFRRFGYCVVVLCENQPAPDGTVLGSSGEPRWVDDFGHAYFDSPAEHLATRLREHLGVRVRIDKPGTLQRISTAHASSTDLAEAEDAGQAGCRLALDGRSDVMVTLLRDSDQPYHCSLGTAPLAEVANSQRRLSDEFIGGDGRGVTTAFERYARPLLGDPLPDYARLISPQRPQRTQS